MTMRLFIGGLPNEVNEDDVRKRFGKLGKVIDCCVPKNKIPGRTRGFAFVTFSNETEGQKCQKIYNRAKWCGNVIRVEVAKADHLERLQERWVDRRRKNVAKNDVASVKLAFERIKKQKNVNYYLVCIITIIYQNEEN
eukprot:UN23111